MMLEGFIEIFSMEDVDVEICMGGFNWEPPG